ncbi:MAG: hypothetical protein PHR26_02335 [Candidatus ainarchaeum sp.]|nr:hypothetical protein [Candidatus ainarchaeum sp.]MDD3976341.1 hypothetical protein [Candidatus ainarchaeum sp.]
MKNTINKTKDLEEFLKKKINSENKKYIDLFFKKKTMQIKNNKIIYPEIKELKEETEYINKKIKELKKNIHYWQKEKNNAHKYHKIIPLYMLLNKKFWKHKIKSLVDKEYKKDLQESKLEDIVLMDPQYKNLFNTFLIDPDYRQKLKETINNSIVYKNSQIGDYSKKKQEFKEKNAEHKIAQLKIKLEEQIIKKKINSKIIEIIKKL